MTDATGGLNSGNWDLQSVQVKAVSSGFTRKKLNSPAGPYRFTGAKTPLLVAVP